MSARVTVSLGLFLCALSLTYLALAVRRYAPGRSGDVWRVWSEPPYHWVLFFASYLVGSFIIDVDVSIFPQQARIIQGVFGFGALIVGGLGLWWLMRKTTLR